MEFTVRLAGISIRIRSIYDEVYSLCRDYLTDSEPDIFVVTSQADIDNEREKNILEALTEGLVPVDYLDSYLETLAVYRKTVTQVLKSDILLMHGAVIAVGDKAWLFTAPSGTGKTTHIRLWLDNIKGSFVVNGDKPLIRTDDRITVFGTPWAGKEGMQKNVGVRLCGIVFLERGSENRIDRIGFSQALPTMIQQTYRPDEKDALEKTLEIIKKLGSSLPLYRLQCNMQPEAALTAYEALSKEPAPKDLDL